MKRLFEPFRVDVMLVTFRNRGPRQSRDVLFITLGRYTCPYAVFPECELERLLRYDDVATPKR